MGTKKSSESKKPSISIRVEATDLKLIERAAALKGLTVAGYCRALALVAARGEVEAAS